MGEFILRQPTEADAPAMVDAFLEVAAEGRWIGTELPVDRQERIEAWTRSMADPAWFLRVADVDGLIVGQLSLTVKRGRADLGMGLVEAARGRGIGSAMMEEAIAWARRQELDKIFLMVWPHNERALKLYEKFGFVREGYHPKHHRRRSGEAWDVIAMGLVLRE